ncbi:unnamed protein product, partial [Porites lobata]
PLKRLIATILHLKAWPEGLGQQRKWSQAKQTVNFTKIIT